MFHNILHSVSAVAVMLLLLPCSRASIVNRGGKIVIGNGAYVKLAGGDVCDFINRGASSPQGTVRIIGSLYLGGDFVNEDASASAVTPDSTGTVVLDGTDQAISGSNTFPGLTKNVSVSATLTFGAGASNRTVITGTWTCRGAAGKLLLLRSAVPGTQWEVEPRGGRVLGFLDVKDSNNVSASVIDVSGQGCTDSGNNSNWLFSGGATYTVTFAAGPNGSIAGTSHQTVLSGADCQPVTAVPDPGFSFAGWTGGQTGNDNPLTVRKVSSDMNITANFTEAPPGSHTVNFLSGEGGVISGVASQTVADGADCAPVTAVPYEGYSFLNWTGGHSGTENPLTIKNVKSDMTVTANFSTAAFTVTFNAGAGGSISGDTKQTVVSGGDCTPVTAVPDIGFYFYGWTGDYVGKANPLKVKNVLADMDITANFAALPLGNYLVSFYAGAGGSLSGKQFQLVGEHASCAPVTAVPAAGRRFTGWTGDYTGADNPLKISDVVANMSVTANFAENPPGTFTVAFVPGSNGTISGSISQTVASGGDCAPVTAEPGRGYTFINWTGDFTGTDNPLTVTNVQADMLITANFAVPGDNVANGKYIVLLPSDIPGYAGDEFAYKPTVAAIYPFANRVPMRVLNKISAEPPLADQADCAWTKNIPLVDIRRFKKNWTCRENLAAMFPPDGAIPPLVCDLLQVTVTDTDGNRLKDVDSGDAILQAPVISRVMNAYGAETVSATMNEIFFIKGVFFGQRPPSVWLEYPVYEKGNPAVKQIKALKLRILKPYAFADYAGNEGKSCMDLTDAESEIQVLMPSKWPKGWDHDVPHNIVIDNKVGRATSSFWTH